MLLTTGDLPTFKARAATTHSEIWHSIQAYVDSRVGDVPPDAAPPDSELDVYRNAGNELIALSFVCAITRADQHCTLARDFLLAYARWEQWDVDNVRGLGHAHLLTGVALSYDWLYPDLSPQERRILREVLGRRAQELYDVSHASASREQRAWWARSYMQNYYWVMHSSLGMAGLALLGEDQAADRWLDLATLRLTAGKMFLEGSGDGTWHESIAYQSYMLTMTVPFWISLRDLHGTDLIPHTYMQNYTSWRLYNYLPDTIQTVMAYGDFERPWNGHLAHLLRFNAGEYDDGYAEWLAQSYIRLYGRTPGIWSAPWQVFEFLVYDPAIEPTDPANVPRARVFDDLEAVIWRTGWNYHDLVFALKSGPFGGRYAFDTFVNETGPWEVPCSESGCQLNIDHDHLDTNGFYIYQSGGWLAPETEGVGNRQTAFHNTLLIDGTDQYEPPPEHYGTLPEDFAGSDGFLRHVASTPDADYVVADATNRYVQLRNGGHYTRHVLFVRPDYLLMVDFVASSQAHRYEWTMHAERALDVDANWLRAESYGDRGLGVAVLAPAPFASRSGDDGYPYVRISPRTRVPATQFVTLFYPTSEASWAQRPVVRLIEQNGDAVAVRTQHSSGQIDDLIIKRQATGEQMATGGYALNSSAALLTYDARGKLQRLWISDGSLLKQDKAGTTLLEAPENNGAVQVDYSTDTVYISTTALGGEIRLFAPQADNVLLNGVAVGFSRVGDAVIVEAAQLSDALTSTGQ